MNTSNDFEAMSTNDVISKLFGSSLDYPETFKAAEFLKLILKKMDVKDSQPLSGLFLGEKGQNCEVLRLSSGRWEKGRVRIRLEFCSDEPEDLVQSNQGENSQTAAPPESPLDSIRKMIAEES